jgi:flagellar biosynthesis component FlhA
MRVQPATTVVAVMPAVVMPMMAAMPMVPMPVMSTVIAMMAPTVMHRNDASSPEQRDSREQDCDQRFSNFHIRHFT